MLQLLSVLKYSCKCPKAAVILTIIQVPGGESYLSCSKQFLKQVLLVVSISNAYETLHTMAAAAEDKYRPPAASGEHGAEHESADTLPSYCMAMHTMTLH